MRYLVFAWTVALAGSFLAWRTTRYAGRRALRLLHGLAGVGLALVIGGPALVGGSWYWYHHRAQPESAYETPFEGVTYIRDVRQEPQPIVVHVVKIDLDAPGIRFLVTPGEAQAGQEVAARRTTDFLDEFDVQIAINGDFFEPWAPGSHPHAGELLDVKGYASSQGVVYSLGQTVYPTLFISADNRAQIGAPPGEVYNAISGDVIFLQDGAFRRDNLRGRYHFQRNPRTAVALDAKGRTLMLVAVDGRQPNYSEGVTLEQLADIVLEHGGWTALNLDGGGSTTLVVEGQSGRPITLNSPVDRRIPGWERPVGNHLGVYAIQAPSYETAGRACVTVAC